MTLCLFFQIENDLANERNTIVFKLDVVCTRQEGRIKNATGLILIFLMTWVVLFNIFVNFVRLAKLKVPFILFSALVLHVKSCICLHVKSCVCGSLFMAFDCRF